MKTLTPFVKAFVLFLICLLPNVVFANTDFGQELTPVIKSQLSKITFKKKNLTVGKLTLTNKTNKKTGKTVYGGLTLIVTKISSTKVTLSNLSGYTEEGQPYLLIPNTSPLLPKKNLKNIALQFNNPGGKSFKVSYKIYGSLTASQLASTTIPIPSTSQTIAKSGTEITLTGENFTRASSVQIAGQTIEPKFISNQQLSITVPFTVNTQNQLIPLAVGEYPIQVDGSAALNLTVESLPDNPNPPGQLINNVITPTFDAISQVAAQLQADLPNLLEATNDQPNTQKFIQGLADIVNELNAQGEANLSQLVGKMDAQSLDTLERGLLDKQGDTTNNIIQPTAQSVTLKSSAALLTQKTVGIDGDAWLSKRKSISQITNTLNTTASISGYCASTLSFVVGAVPVAAAPAAVCVSASRRKK